MPKFVSWFLGALIVPTALASPALTQTAPGTSVLITGCVYQEDFLGSCTGIRDSSGQSYQINAAIPPPTMLRVVTLRGTVSGRLDICIMGPVLENIRVVGVSKARCPLRSRAR